MVNYSVVCRKCGRVYGSDFRGFRCSCGGVLEVVVDLSEVKSITVGGLRGVFRYAPLLPKLGKHISLGEGGTPVISAEKYGLSIFFKLEYLNPTGSFKDRGSAVAVSKALELGVNEVLEDSSGNTGISIAAYAAYAGIKAHIYVPSDIPLGKYRLIKSFGANVVKAGSRDEASELVLKNIKEGSYYIGHTWNPYFIEGTKTLAYEVFEELPKIDYVIMPVASGSLLLGFWKGFNELMRLGLVSDVPKLVAVQACGYESLKKYLSNVVSVECRGYTALADAIRLTNAPRLPYIAEAITNSGGYVVVVNDELIKWAVKELYRMGLVVEPTSAAAYAALKLVRGDLSGRVLIPLTGSGLKYIADPASGLYGVFEDG